MTIKWCKNCNLPVAGAKCNRCGDIGKKLRFSGSEPYPALDYHRAILNKLLENCGVHIPQNEFILLSDTSTSATKALKEKYYQVIVRGIDIGGYYFSPWKLDYIDAFHTQALKEFEKRGSEITPFDSNEEMLDELVKANIGHINEIENRSKEFILKEVKRSGRPAVVLFSGGNDSRITLHLAYEVLKKDLYILFSSAGAEVPANKGYINKTIDEMEMQDKFFIASAKQSFQDEIQKFGPPTGDSRWCDKVFKLGPIASLAKEKFQNGCIMVWGLRMGESVDRIIKPIYRDNFVNQLGLLPIITWSKLDDYLYIYKYKIDINPCYKLGLNAVACYICPANLEYFQIIKSEYTNLWNGWQKFLRDWAKSYNLPDSWIRYSLWRCTRVPKDIIRGLKANGIDTAHLKEYHLSSPSELFISYSERILHIGHRREVLHEDLKFSFEGSISRYTPTDENSVEGFFNKPIDFKQILNPLKIFGECEHEKSSNLIKLRRNSWSIFLFSDGKFKINYKDLTKKKAITILKPLKEIIWRSTYCSACGLCVSWCPQNALVLNQRVEVNENLCNHCLECLKCYCPTHFLRKSDILSRIKLIFKYINLSPNWDLKRPTQERTFKDHVLNVVYKLFRALAIKLGGRQFIHNTILVPSINFFMEYRSKNSK